MQRIRRIQRISNLLATQKLKLLFSTIKKSQFSYCPLVQMFFLRQSNSLVNNNHERALRVVNDGHTSSIVIEKARTKLAIFFS